MDLIKLIVIGLLAGNFILFGVEASKPPAQESSPTNIHTATGDIPGIRLLSELESVGMEQAGRQCYTVGPFEANPTVQAIVGILKEFTSEVSTRETEAFVDHGYWVYLPPSSNEQSAHSLVNSLYDLGLDDVVLIRNKQREFVVSLGLFIDQVNAVRRRDAVRDLGYPAEYRVKRDDEIRYWVDYEQKVGAEYASRVLSGVIPPELHRLTACPSEAGFGAS